jgi:hypothetical protein
LIEWAKVMGWVAAHEAEEEKKRTQFEKGNTGGPGRGKTVEPKTVPPFRDLKKKVENSTAGKIAAKAGVSRHKAEQAVATKQIFAESGCESPTMATVQQIAQSKVEPHSVDYF